MANMIPVVNTETGAETELPENSLAAWAERGWVPKDQPPPPLEAMRDPESDADKPPKSGKRNT